MGLAREELELLWQRRHLLGQLVRNDLIVTHTNTALGWCWWLVTPLADTALYAFVFGTILQTQEPHYPLFLVVSIFLWRAFQASLKQSTNAYLANRELLAQVRFPRSVLVLAPALSSHLQFCFCLPILLATQALSGTGPTLHVLCILPVLAVQFMVTLAVGLTLSWLAVRVPDVQNLTDIALRFAFFASPSIYALDRVPHAVLPVYLLNPFATILPAARRCFLEGAFPRWGGLGLVAVASLAALGAAFLVWARQEREVLKEL